MLESGSGGSAIPVAITSASRASTNSRSLVIVGALELASTRVKEAPTCSRIVYFDSYVKNRARRAADGGKGSALRRVRSGWGGNVPEAPPRRGNIPIAA